jgi:hypothetical protein
MLVSTRSFSVWGCPQKSTTIEGSASKDKKIGNVVVGGRRVTLDEVVKVAVKDFQVVLDPVMSQTYEDSSSSMPGSRTFSSSEGKKSSGPALPRELCRAAVFSCIAGLMQLKSGVRFEVVEFLTDAINCGVVPCFSSVSNAQLELVNFITGQSTQCYTSSGIVSASVALEGAGIDTLPALYDYEGNTLVYGQFTLPGMAALVAAGAVRTFKALDAVTSFSCEAVEASAAPFEADRFDVLRPHRGQMNAAANMRLLLESSGNTTSSVSRATECFLQIPQVNGPATEAITAAARCRLPFVMLSTLMLMPSDLWISS